MVLGIEAEVVEIGSASELDLLTSFAASAMTMLDTWSKIDTELGEDGSSHLSLILGRW